MATTTSSSSFLRPPPLFHHHRRRHLPPPSASFRLSELLGGRGLCNGEVGLQKELSSSPSPSPSPSSSPTTTTSATPTPSPSAPVPSLADPAAFDKELMGLTGGFPGGEVGLEAFLAKNPPPPKNSPSPKNQEPAATAIAGVVPAQRPRPPELPLFLPGMVVLVKNPMNPFYMYCGVVQRVTDGKVGVLFEGGNWDKLLTFQLDELERRDKGPPMVNPKSVVLEAIAAEKEEEEPEKQEDATPTEA